MATVMFKGSPVHTIGELPQKGSKAPDFCLTKPDLTDVSLDTFRGKKKILNIVHSLDTGTCATSAKKFEVDAGKLENAIILTISNDLPFAQERFCRAENINNVITLSQMRNREFGKAYGVDMLDGPIVGLLARSIVVLDEQDQVIYTEQVREITEEPNYQSAIDAVNA